MMLPHKVKTKKTKHFLKSHYSILKKTQEDLKETVTLKTLKNKLGHLASISCMIEQDVFFHRFHKSV